MNAAPKFAETFSSSAVSRQFRALSLPMDRASSLRMDRALVTLDEMVAILSGSTATAATLAHALRLLADGFGLRGGGVALLGDDGMLQIFVGRGLEAPPQKPSARAREIFAAGAAGILRKGKPLVLAAPILADGRPIGLLKAQAGPGADLDTDLLLLGLAANLIGPPLAMARRAPSPVVAESPDPRRIVGDSPALRHALDLARRIARTNLAVLLRGESGSGKELFAQLIHDLSSRREKPFIKVNCAALPESILESELFGHERGAFTGAVARRKGRFELADGGALLLDEIGDIPLSFQAKLLRVLQEGEFERVGGSETIKVNVRVIAATHCDLEVATARKSFRADLYYRLSVAQIRVPALHERRDDIPALAEHVLARFNAENASDLRLHPAAIGLLCKCAFPGNIRELENCVRAAAAMARGTQIVETDFACRNRCCFSSRLRQTRRAATPPAPPLLAAI